MKPFSDISDATEAIKAYNGKPEDFLLPISDERNDPNGFKMAMLGDLMLSRNWIPNVFEQKDGYRVYKYRAMELP